MKHNSAKSKGKIPGIIILLGIFCPIIFVLYFLFRYRSDVTAVGSSFKTSSSTEQVTTGGQDMSDYGSPSSQSTDSSNPFTFVDGAGNMCESGGVFVDWAGNLIQWGNCFQDSRGNWVEWGNPFYDNKGYYVGWGQPFYDARNNYINPRG